MSTLLWRMLRGISLSTVTVASVCEILLCDLDCCSRSKDRLLHCSVRVAAAAAVVAAAAVAVAVALLGRCSTMCRVFSLHCLVVISLLSFLPHAPPLPLRLGSGSL